MSLAIQPAAKRLLLLLALNACSTAVQTTQEEINERGSYTLYFSNPLPSIISRLRTSNEGPDDTIVDQWAEVQDYQIGSGGDFATALSDLMGIAQGRQCKLLVADYEFDVDQVAHAMAAAKQRGCDTRFITDGHTVDDPKSAQALGILRAAGVEIHHDGGRGAIMHNKFAVIVGDNDSALWTGSWNFTEADQVNYWNHGIAIRSAKAIPIYTEYFENLYARFGADGSVAGRTPLTLPEGRTFSAGAAQFEVYFPATDKAQQRITELLLSAKESIHIMAFAFTSKPFIAAIAERASAGVQVEMIVENTGACKATGSAFRSFSELGLPNVQLTRWKPGTKSFLHHKVFIIDGRTVVFGSYNFSDAGENTNDENVVISASPEVAQPFDETFELIELVAALVPQEEGCSE